MTVEFLDDVVRVSRNFVFGATTEQFKDINVHTVALVEQGTEVLQSGGAALGEVQSKRGNSPPCSAGRGASKTNQGVGYS